MLDDISKAAGGVVDALKTQPLTLSLVLMNLGLLGFLYYEGASQRTSRQREIELLYENNREVAQLLVTCTTRK